METPLSTLLLRELTVPYGVALLVMKQIMSHTVQQPQTSILELSLQQSHNKPYSQTLTQHSHFHHLPHHSNEASSGVMRAQRMRWPAALHSRFVQLLSGHPSKGLNSKDGSKEENALNGLSGMVSSPTMLLTPHREEEILQPNNLKIFPFKDLKTATRNFHPDFVLGDGDSGIVLKGWTDEKTFVPTRPGTGMIIAVKRLNLELRCQGPSELLTEINYVGQLHHPNLVKLIGYCLEDDHCILVYEFMAKGSLDNHLFRRSSYFRPLSWTIRKKVALDVAKGLAFLQSDEVGVIHRDFKTSNILLDSKYNAKLTDFGFATNGSEEDETYLDILDSVYFGRVTDSSYTAPEYNVTGHLTKKSYVYSFGVVLLELMSARRARDFNRPISEHNLVEWAKPFLVNKRKIPLVMDTRIQGQYSYREAKRIADLAIDCLSIEQKDRPNIDEVVRSLEHLQDSKDTGDEDLASRSNH
ncbi:hypothetical protein Fmac_014606 [Flemingia macrophylla]|uniref:non-specific serine/threonine protein kinase n=1 Tax=Flemingia macrophylla TaxID=520843 RepID=A0ABD1MCY2_9FABA